MLDSDGGSYEVLIDNRALRTPGRRSMRVPKQGLAVSLAAEWASQKNLIQPAQMPLTTLLVTAVDTTQIKRKMTIDELMRYLRGDTICYFARESEYEGELLHEQRETWLPIHDWFKDVGGPLGRSEGTLASPAHPKETVSRVRDMLVSLDSLKLTALHNVTTTCKSLVLALALMNRRLTAEEAVAAARVDEEFQISEWVSDCLTDCVLSITT